jgi:hypothetical protein
MQFKAPTKTTWYIAVALGAVGLIGYLFTIPVLTALAFWLVLIGLILMVLAPFIKGL